MECVVDLALAVSCLAEEAAYHRPERGELRAVGDQAQPPIVISRGRTPSEGEPRPGLVSRGANDSGWRPGRFEAKAAPPVSGGIVEIHFVAGSRSTRVMSEPGGRTPG